MTRSARTRVPKHRPENRSKFARRGIRGRVRETRAGTSSSTRRPAARNKSGASPSYSDVQATTALVAGVRHPPLLAGVPYTLIRG
ncbi:hypothetical protein EEB14_24995 [Rhodococcus sp. WS4]|nr:hypothetical protein EEB14_24995 [Rhodococcus sp. WS4]